MKKSNLIGKKVIVRADRAGVFYGTLVAKTGDEVTLENVRKLWYWSGACGVEQIALEGVKNPDRCQFTVVVSEMEITGVIQVLPCTEAAVLNLDAVKEWKR